jgi:glycyl-tRNA synthetase
MATEQNKDFTKLIGHCKEYGFVFQSSEIYDGLSAVYDYGPYGSELKNNIKAYWWKAMVQMHENIVGIDSSIFMHPTTWKASGHVDAFNDPLIDNKASKKRYRADVLVEDYMAKIEGKIKKEVAKAKKRFKDAFNEAEFRSTHPRVLANQAKIDTISARLGKAMTDGDLGDMKALIEELEIACPVSGSRDWTDVRQFNLMFSTQLGSVADDSNTIYLRPETAQGIFVNFLNVQKTARQKVPFGIAQIGKAFRNEIVARQFIFRMREFEQMEMQFFVRPGTEEEYYESWKEARMKWHKVLGTASEKLRFHDHEKLAHYASAASDIEFEFPFGFKEMEGIHSRGDFDLMQHQEHSKKKQQFFDPEVNKNYVPYVVETSIGADRLFLAMLSQAYTELEVTEGEKTKTRIFLKFPPAIAPVKVAVLPLVKKDGLAEKGMEIFDLLKYDYKTIYEAQQAIGRRYTRQDLIGTPFCVAVDYQTMEDDTVTVRERDTTEQVRMPISELHAWIGERVSMTALLRQL